jgi:hypothetical protein
MGPPRVSPDSAGIRDWSRDGRVRPIRPAELVAYSESTLKHSDAVHSAYANLATAYYAFDLARRQRALEKEQLGGRERAAHMLPPSGWVARLTMVVTCCTNTSSASSTTLAGAEVFMPIRPEKLFCYVMHAGACARALGRVCRGCQCARSGTCAGPPC